MASSDVKMRNLDKVLARLADVPLSVQQAAGDQLYTEVEGLTEAQRRAAADDPDTAGSKIAEGIRFYQNPDRPLSFRIISDARDEDGKPIAANVEHGHRARNGTHVTARPSFFPMYRARKRGMRRRMSAAARKAIKALFPE